MQRIKVLVSGRVQGVFYRQKTRETASSLGLVGWVRNLSNGCVEIEAYGSEEQLKSLIEWCRQGPPMAQVTRVEEDWGDGAETSRQDNSQGTEFVILRDG